MWVVGRYELHFSSFKLAPVVNELKPRQDPPALRTRLLHADTLISCLTTRKGHRDSRFRIPATEAHHECRERARPVAAAPVPLEKTEAVCC